MTRESLSDVSVIINPATEEAIAEVCSTTIEGMDRTIDAAEHAFAHWRKVAPDRRADLMRRFADLVDAHVEELALLEMRNSGHTITKARWEAENVRNVLRYFAGAPERLIGKQIPVEEGLDVTIYEPVGIVGIIVPWNFPMPIAAWAMAPAIAAGNVVIIKPAELTPLTALRLGELAEEAGFPSNVIQVMPGRGDVVGRGMVDDPRVSKICFTGSTVVGRELMARGSASLKRLTLELGGKSANIIFADADIDKAAESAPGAVFDNAGQDCCARSRILVQEDVYDQFMERLSDAVARVRVADPSLPDAEMGPLISGSHRRRVQSFLESADIVCAGTMPSGPGFWVRPTVVAPQSVRDRVWTEEIFGPVAAVFPFKNEADAISIANASDFGLSGSIFTRDVGRAIRVSRGVQAGTISVNSHASVRYWTPFGGYKQSGIGRELGPDAAMAFCEEKNVFVSSQ